MARRSQSPEDYDPSTDPNADLDAATADAGWLLSSANALIVQSSKAVSPSKALNLARAFRWAYREARSTIRPIAFELRGLPLTECRIGTAVGPSCHQAVLEFGRSVDATIRVALRRGQYGDEDVRDNWNHVAKALRSFQLRSRIDEDQLDRRLQKENAMVARDRKLSRAPGLISQPVRTPKPKRKLLVLKGTVACVGNREFQLPDHDEVVFLRALIAYEGSFISGPEISRLFLGGRKARFDRIRRKLPDPIRRLIEAQAPKGFKLSRTSSR
jgi:hypothetical protein